MVSSASGHAYGPTVSWSKQPSVLLTVRSHSIPGLANSRDLQHTHAAASALPHRHCRIYDPKYNIHGVFYLAAAFNQNIGSWNMGAVSTMATPICM